MKKYRNNDNTLAKKENHFLWKKENTQKVAQTPVAARLAALSPALQPQKNRQRSPLTGSKFWKPREMCAKTKVPEMARKLGKRKCQEKSEKASIRARNRKVWSGTKGPGQKPLHRKCRNNQRESGKTRISTGKIGEKRGCREEDAGGRLRKVSAKLANSREKTRKNARQVDVRDVFWEKIAPRACNAKNDVFEAEGNRAKEKWWKVFSENKEKRARLPDTGQALSENS